jgi:hypothetical protein
VLSTLASPIAPLAVCSSIESICQVGGSITKACKTNYDAITQSSQLTSCICQSSLLSAASVCEFNGNITCLMRSAALSNIDLWYSCPVSTVTSTWSLWCYTDIFSLSRKQRPLLRVMPSKHLEVFLALLLRLLLFHQQRLRRHKGLPALHPSPLQQHCVIQEFPWASFLLFLLSTHWLENMLNRYTFV